MTERDKTDDGRQQSQDAEADGTHDRRHMKVTHMTDPSPGKPKRKDQPTGIMSEDWETGAVDPLNKR